MGHQFDRMTLSLNLSDIFLLNPEYESLLETAREDSGSSLYPIRWDLNVDLS